MQKILIIRLSSIGDITHTYPMIVDIKAHYPDCSIDWLVDESLKNIVEIHPLINKIYTIPLRKWKKNKLAAVLQFRSWCKALPTERYNYIIDVQGLLKSAVLAKCFSGKVHGFDAYSSKEWVASLFYTYKYRIDKQLLAITQNRLLASKVLQYNIDITQVQFGLSLATTTVKVIPFQRPYVIFFHATSSADKKVDGVLWAELAQYIIKNSQYNIVLPYGNENERLDSINIKNLIACPESVIVPPLMPMQEIAHLIVGAEFVFGVDTGFVHLAGAFNQRVIALYIVTSPTRTGLFETAQAKNIGGINNTLYIDNIIAEYNVILGQTS